MQSKEKSINHQLGLVGMSYPASARRLCLNTEFFLLHLGTKQNVSEGSEMKLGEPGTEQHLCLLHVRG